MKMKAIPALAYDLMFSWESKPPMRNIPIQALEVPKIVICRQWRTVVNAARLIQVVELTGRRPTRSIMIAPAKPEEQTTMLDAVARQPGRMTHQSRRSAHVLTKLSTRWVPRLLIPATFKSKVK